MKLRAGMRVECVLDDGTRLGPVELIACQGEHAILDVGGIGMPVPARMLVPLEQKKRTRPVDSGERMLSAS